MLDVARYVVHILQNKIVKHYWAPQIPEYSELSPNQYKGKDVRLVRMKHSWPQLEVQVWRREGALIKMSLGCQSDLQIYCGESLGQKSFIFFRSDRALFCWTSSLKYLLALIVVRVNANILNQTMISGAQVSNNHLWWSNSIFSISTYQGVYQSRCSAGVP